MIRSNARGGVQVSTGAATRVCPGTSEQTRPCHLINHPYSLPVTERRAEPAPLVAVLFLEARGLVTKSRREDGRRLVDLRLTPEGIALMNEIYPKFNAVESRVVAGLSGRRKKELTDSLRTIVTDLEQRKEKPGQD